MYNGRFSELFMMSKEKNMAYLKGGLLRLPLTWPKVLQCASPAGGVAAVMRLTRTKATQSKFHTLTTVENQLKTTRKQITAVQCLPDWFLY